VELINQILLAVVPVLLLATGTAIYVNRRKSEKLYQRLFGLEDDPQDEGYIPTMSTRLDEINDNVNELNHQRINNIEDRMDTLSERIGDVQAHLKGEKDE